MKRYSVTAMLGIVLISLTAFRLMHRNHSRGLFVRIVTTQCSSPNFFDLGRSIRLRIDGSGSLFINSDPTSSEQVSGRLANVYKTRNERVLFFDASDAVSYQRCVEVINLAQSAVPSLQVVLITPRTRLDCEQLWRPIPSSAE